jgi:glycosyltransferase involved in cell wall biosynthesis
MAKVKILAYRPTYTKNYGIDYAATVIACNMNNEAIESDVVSIYSELKNTSHSIKTVFSLNIYKLLSKILSPKTIRKLSDRKFLKLMDNYDIAYLWPGCSIDVFRKLKQKNKKIVIECVNCHQQVAKDILDKESVLLRGLQTHTITRLDIEEEMAKLDMADFVFSPSPQVSASLLKMQVDESKIIETSYGLDKVDLSTNDSKPSTDVVNTAFTALFVGSVIPRKGIHLLLDYWKTAGIKGKLKIIGKIEPTAEIFVKPYLEDLTIEFVSFTNDLAFHYKNADVFIMPSLEEGSPLVTYLAIGAGLPCLVSPMAGDGVIRHNIDGYILPPHDKNAWVEAIQKLANDKSLRSKLAVSARERSEDFLWPKVAQKRAAEILNKLGTG